MCCHIFSNIVIEMIAYEDALSRPAHYILSYITATFRSCNKERHQAAQALQSMRPTGENSARSRCRERWFRSTSIHYLCHSRKSPSVNVPTQWNFSARPICRFTAITPSLRKIILFGPLTNRSSGGNASSSMLIWDRRLFLWSNRLKYRLVFDNDFVWPIATSSTSISRMDKVWLSLIRFARCIRFESPFQHAVICEEH